MFISLCVFKNLSGVISYVNFKLLYIDMFLIIFIRFFLKIYIRLMNNVI